MQHKLQYYSLILQILLQITNANNTYKCDNNNCRSSNTITINVNVNNNYLSGLGIRSSVFRANCSFFAQKWANEQYAQKNEQFNHLLIFGERPERFSHNRSFPLSDLSKSLMVTHFWWATWAIRSHRSPKKREWANRSFFI